MKLRDESKDEFKSEWKRESKKEVQRVRLLLRVSSEQQLEADGDLSVQRQIILDYVNKQENWYLDEKEYFEGSKSAYKNTARERTILQEILQDARRKEFQILVLYKDDRVGRLMWDTPLYIMELKQYGVDVYSVKDGCISPETDDIMGQMMLTFRYANAQKSSADTGMRVKDTAQKLVQRGKFMGGAAPYGYRLEYSGEISKHGRALKQLVVEPEQANVVKYIYNLSLNKEYGSSKIARALNEDIRFCTLAPNDVWKSGTITSILTNPIYTGRTAYKRRERIGGRYHRLESRDWVVSEQADDRIAIISDDIWNRTQERRKMRGDRYRKSQYKKSQYKKAPYKMNPYKKNDSDQDVKIISRNDGELSLIDVIHCGYCGRKMTNGSRYNYWTIKGTGEKKTRKVSVYRCQNARDGVPHARVYQFRADEMEPLIFEVISYYIGKLMEKESVFDEIERNDQLERHQREKTLKKEKKKLDEIGRKIEVMESNIPNAMTGTYPLSLEELAGLIQKQKSVFRNQQSVVSEKEREVNDHSVTRDEWLNLRQEIPTWQNVFFASDSSSKRVLVNRLIERIEVTREQVVVRFKVNLDEFSMPSRMNGDHGVPKSRV